MSMPEDNINRMSVTIIPPSHIVNYAYTATFQIEYMGHAKKGSATSAAVWTVRKYTYTAQKQIETERVAHNIAWDDYAGASYS